MTLNVTGNELRWAQKKNMVAQWLKVALAALEGSALPLDEIVIEVPHLVSHECAQWMASLQTEELKDILNQMITHYSGNERYNAKGGSVPFLSVEENKIHFNKNFLPEAKAACEALTKGRETSSASKRKATDDDSAGAGAGEAKKQCSSSLRRTPSAPTFVENEDGSTTITVDGLQETIFTVEKVYTEDDLKANGDGTHSLKPEAVARENNKLLGKGVPPPLDLGKPAPHPAQTEAEQKMIKRVKYRNKCLENYTPATDPPLKDGDKVVLSIGPKGDPEGQLKLVEMAKEVAVNYLLQGKMHPTKDSAPDRATPLPKVGERWTYKNTDISKNKNTDISKNKVLTIVQVKGGTILTLEKGRNMRTFSLSEFRDACEYSDQGISDQETWTLPDDQVVTVEGKPFVQDDEHGSSRWYVKIQYGVSHSLLCEAILTLESMEYTPLYKLTWESKWCTTYDDKKMKALRLLKKAGLLPDVEECDTAAPNGCLGTSWDSTDHGLVLLDFLNGKPEELTEEVQEFVRNWVLFIVQQKDDTITWESYEAGTVVENTLKEIRQACSFFLKLLGEIQNKFPNPEEEQVKESDLKAKEIIEVLLKLGVLERNESGLSEVVDAGVPLLAILSKHGSDEDIWHAKALFCQIGMNVRHFDDYLYPALKKDQRLGGDTIVGKFMYEIMNSDDELCKAPNRVLQKLCLAHSSHLKGEAKLNNEMKQIVALFCIKNDLEDKGRPKTPDQQPPQSQAQYDKSCAEKEGIKIDDIDPEATSALCDSLALEFVTEAAADCELVLEESDTAFDYRPEHMSDKEVKDCCEYLVRQGVLLRNDEDKDTDEPYFWNDVTDGLEAFAKRVIKTKKEMKTFLKRIDAYDGANWVESDMANRLMKNFQGEANSEADSDAESDASEAESDDDGQMPLSPLQSQMY